MTYFLLYEADRHQYNPKELSLSKNEGKAFLSATWGPRGSGPNASCALVTLMSSSRIALHVSSSFHMSWREVDVFSETLYAFFEKAAFTMQSTKTSSAKAPVVAAEPVKGSKKRRRTGAAVADESPPPVSASANSLAEYTHRCGLLATLTVAWSPFVLAQDQVTTTSLLAFSGRKVSTIWGYASPSFAAERDVSESFLSPAPVAWIDTEKHGWVSTSAWQQMHYDASKPTEHLTLVMGTTAGSVLLATVPVSNDSVGSGGFPPELAIDRVVMVPHCQPVFHVSLGARALSSSDCAKRNDLVVASGSTISVWNASRKRATPTSWRAHDGNVTGLGIDYFGDTVYSCGVDGALKAWDKDTGVEVPFRSVSSAPSSDSSSSKYPLYGLAVSPSSAQLACVHIIPPAARPNRKSQADVSYSRVSSALEYVPSRCATDPDAFVRAMCRVLDARASLSAFTDVLWFCYEDNSAITSLHGSADMTIPNLLNKLKGVSHSRENERSRQPLYLSLCDALEQQYAAAVASAGPIATSPTVSTLALPSLAAIRYVQASYLLRSCIVPAENHVAIRDAALVVLQRTLLGYWAERCLTELVSTHSHVENFASISSAERTSALLMADFLSVQTPLSDVREQLVTTVYTRLGSDDNIAQWLAHLQARNSAEATAATPSTLSSDDGSPTDAAAPVPTTTPTLPPTPPPRQTCFICHEPVPFAEFDLVCASGHAQERCFLSFQVLTSLDAWRCMGCNASACALDFASGTSPFYLLESQRQRLATESNAAGSATAKITCRLCGNFCSFFAY